MALNALVSVFLMIVLGWALRRARFPGDVFWAPVERLTYYLFFPALLVGTLAGADLEGVFASGLVPALLAAIAVIGMGVVVTALLLGGDAPLTAGMVTMSHLGGCVTLPVALWLLVG